MCTYFYANYKQSHCKITGLNKNVTRGQEKNFFYVSLASLPCIHYILSSFPLSEYQSRFSLFFFSDRYFSTYSGCNPPFYLSSIVTGVLICAGFIPSESSFETTAVFVHIFFIEYKFHY